MHWLPRILLAVVLVLFPAHSLLGEAIDGGVIQVRMPVEDVTLLYWESRGGMTLELEAESASIQARKLYLGDGEIAVELVVEPLKGIVFQGETVLSQGFQFKRDSVVDVLPGYKKASDLAPGDIYVTLPAVTFKMPKTVKVPGVNR